MDIVTLLISDSEMSLDMHTRYTKFLAEHKGKGKVVPLLN
jgi:hypothetical protein